MSAQELTRTCTVCHKVKSYIDFHKRTNGGKNGYQSRCKDCFNALMRQQRADPIRGQCRREYMNKYNQQMRSDPIRRNRQKYQQRLSKIKQVYGITQAEYHQLLALQKGVCAICGNPETGKTYGKVRQLSVDHDHKTGKIRGLLCNCCNRAIGLLRDDMNLLLRATSYLAVFTEQQTLLVSQERVG